MKKKDFETATGIVVSDVMFEFIETVFSCCKQTEGEFCRLWKEGLIGDLLHQVEQPGRMNLIQDLAFKLDYNLLQAIQECNEKDNKLTAMADELKSVNNQLSELRVQCRERRIAMSKQKKEYSSKIDEIFDEIFSDKWTTVASMEQCNNFRTSMEQFFSWDKVIMWKLEHGIKLTPEELAAVQKNMNTE